MESQPMADGDEYDHMNQTSNLSRHKTSETSLHRAAPLNRLHGEGKSNMNCCWCPCRSSLGLITCLTGTVRLDLEIFGFSSGLQLQQHHTSVIPTMPSAAASTKKRKLADSTGPSKSTKKSKSKSSSTKTAVAKRTPEEIAEETQDKILELEEAILESPKNYNNIVTLFGYLTVCTQSLQIRGDIFWSTDKRHCRAKMISSRMSQELLQSRSAVSSFASCQ